MKLSSLNTEAKKSIQEIINIFEVDELIYLDKVEMGNQITARVDALGQNGREYVHYVYTQSTKTNPLATMNPPVWLLCSFLSNLIKSSLKKHGYAHIDDKWEYIELAQDVVDGLE